MEVPIAELEFAVAQRQNVLIIPNFSEPKVELIGGAVGPFRANKEISVPLWLALHLKAAEKCQILAPDWLAHAAIEQKFKNQKQGEELCPLPEFFFETAYLLLRDAKDCLKEHRLIRNSVSDLENRREEKIRSILMKMTDPEKGVVARNLTTFEANKFRALIAKRMETLEKHEEARHGESYGLEQRHQ